MIPGIDPDTGGKLLEVMAGGINCPFTSSVGRLFDGVAAILGLCTKNTYSGQAAIALQSVALPTEASYSVLFSDGTIDWTPGLNELLNDAQDRMSPGIISGKFHNWLCDCAVTVAEKSGEKTVVLTGGCFQNTVLLDGCAGALRTAGFDVYSHHIVPPGDGGLSLGQAVAFFGGV
jgi:hydrogenase maturation protein HypF